MNEENLETLTWTYHGEGNANIILKNTKHNLVLRLRKATVSREKLSSRKAEQLVSLEDEWLYNNKILSFFLKDNTHYLNHGRIVSLSEEFVRYIADLIETYRPTHRKHKQLEQREQKALLMPLLSSFSHNMRMKSGADFIGIEIKPKWGFLPFSSHIDENSIKKKVCRFCLHQTLKLKKGSVSSRSEYCPLDLFGDCSCKIKSGIESLLKTPQNNIAISVNGKHTDLNQTVYDCNMLVDIISEIFVHDSQISDKMMRNEISKPLCLYSKSQHCESECVKVTGNNGVLNLLSTLQQFDDLDIEYLGPIYKDIIEKSEYCETNFLDFQSILWRDFIQKTENSLPRLASGNKEVDFFDVCRYLVSATFKDCSIIIMFCEVDTDGSDAETNERLISIMDQTFVYKIKIIDLDPRFLQNIPYYYELDQEILSCQK